MHSCTVAEFSKSAYHFPQGLSVTGRSKDTPARQCGLEYGDVIQMFATATPEKMGDLQRCFGTISDQDQFERALSEAATNGQSLILVTTRPPPETPQSSHPIDGHGVSTKQHQ